ncbi:MAG: hypothetical protein A3D24_01620 [Candidatus Blackburnbacteria bacterium RIFCSPHIGHO2_02_FULL_39_13]|uniref:Uncharacterized protein n=1 Tax=Candidatus Blackburnbacteria bacterium RIFCSPLOWO2_01_FULL_40_20 TaxID=1797519 RepID=A0A1G1VBV1_9BACT|nr:MAG: hypothetical protein UT38_C0015G0017 [Microgenomates group bacterium GW2011_GWA2_39_19]OGY07471.1 MAG: hypothetical protein A2694_01830 [Candidatus Blackburnbacteria bacterium RIFCSPHIGHO2_01_FULL_40_17]OGY10047.1 MAG: hypothetical protein A3D24_01620 [Candidatus Blackburnbacteria bacterium RIFCSPHIGHO2_02_FULL_39_13]OGY12860.1 MAG: hypothetical protein A3A77_03170 [Candidatus Blackburnbacteria bacterium RIFCSPLOWO2_01_FULL_40_20]
MSAEAPRNPDTREPIHSQKSKGALFASLQRFFGVSDGQPIQPLTSRIIQPPPGLEAFAFNLQQGVNDYVTAQRRIEFDTARENAIRLAAETEERAVAIQRQKELDDQERAREETITRETSKILQGFNIAQSLRYIQETVWGGKGKVRPIENRHMFTDGLVWYGLTVLGGFELVHEYPSCKLMEEYRGDYDFPYTVWRKWQYMPSTDSTSLSVRLTRVAQGDSEEGEKKLLISSSALGSHSNILVEDNEALPELEAALIEEAGYRISHSLLPSQLEQGAKRNLTEAQRSRGWKKWIIEPSR